MAIRLSLLVHFALLLFVLQPFVESRRELTRQDMIDYLRWKQEARTGFDSRFHQRVEPIGTVGGKKIWPRITSRVKSANHIFFDDDNFAYHTNERSVVDVLERMDHEENYNKIMEFLERYVD